MQNFFDYLAARIDAGNSSVLIEQARRAFAKGLKAGLLRKEGRVARTLELVQFCDFDELSRWVQKRPKALARVAQFARAQGQTQLAGILDSALLSNPLVELEWIDEVDWGGIEAMLSLLMQGLELAVLRQLLAERELYDLPLPEKLQQRLQRQAPAVQG